MCRRRVAGISFRPVRRIGFHGAEPEIASPGMMENFQLKPTEPRAHLSFVVTDYAAPERSLLLVSGYGCYK